MTTLDRRRLIAAAAALGASAAWGGARAAPSKLKWTERRDLFPEGVASGDPDHNSVLLWTRYAGDPKGAKFDLQVEVAEDQAFKSVVANSHVRVSAAADFTCRVLVGGLKPSRVYWYRFTDAQGNGSRIGRTRRTANGGLAAGTAANLAVRRRRCGGRPAVGCRLSLLARAAAGSELANFSHRDRS